MTIIKYISNLIWFTYSLGFKWRDPNTCPNHPLLDILTLSCQVGIARLRYRKNRKSNSIDYVSKVRQQKIGTSPEIMPLQCKEQKIQKRILTNSSPKVQMGRMSQELRLSSNSEESEREVATSKSQLIHKPHCWPEVRALRTFLRLRRPCGSAHGGLERWRDKKGEGEGEGKRWKTV